MNFWASLKSVLSVNVGVLEERDEGFALPFAML